MPYYRQNGNPVSFDSEGNLTDQVTNQKGTMILPEITVRGVSQQTKNNNYSSSFNGNYGLSARDIYGVMPIVGDALDLKDIGTDLYKGNYLSAGIGAGMFLLPNVIEKPLKTAGRFLFNKNFRNKILKQTGLKHHSSEKNLGYTMSSFPRDLAYHEAHVIERPNKAEREAFVSNYQRELAKRPSEVYNYSQDSYVNKILQNNPEYAYYTKITGKDPSLQSTVDAFIKRQETSLRGVYSSDKNTAVEALTSTQADRYLRGGDRLGTQGGLYTSNSFGIADAFKNPERSTMDGYIGTLQANFNIDRNLPIDEQLRQTRNKIILSNNSLPLPPSMHQSYLDRARNRGGIAFEAQYARRDGSTLPVHERAYLPTSFEVEHPVKVVNLQHFPHSTNKAGRWGTKGVTHSSKDEELFIPRMLNNTTDFIDLSRTFLEGTPIFDPNKYNVLYDKYSSIINPQIVRQQLLRGKAYDQEFKMNKLKRNIRDLSITSGVLGVPSTLFMYGIKEKNYEQDLRDRKLKYLNKSKEGKQLVDKLNTDPTLTSQELYDQKLDEFFKQYRQKVLNKDAD